MVSAQIGQKQRRHSTVKLMKRQVQSCEASHMPLTLALYHHPLTSLRSSDSPSSSSLSTLPSLCVCAEAGVAVEGLAFLDTGRSGSDSVSLCSTHTGRHRRWG